MALVGRDGRLGSLVAANMKMITTDWATITDFPKVSWLGADMREWLDSADAAVMNSIGLLTGSSHYPTDNSY